MINRAQTSKPHLSRLSPHLFSSVRSTFAPLSLFVSRQIRILPFLSLWYTFYFFLVFFNKLISLVTVVSPEFSISAILPLISMAALGFVVRSESTSVSDYG